MKKIKIFLALIILSLIISSLNANSAIVLNRSTELINAYNNQNLVRLHVVANSNSPGDQYLKRKVRNEIVNYMGSYTNKELILSELDKIEEYVEKVLRQEGADYNAEVSCGNYYFPRRTYDDLTLPEGEYRAMKIVLGAGQGANWWCVLLPPLCIENKDNETKGLEFRLKLTELLKFKTRLAFFSMKE